MVASPAVRSLTIIINLRLCLSTITPANGVMINSGVMKKTCINPRAVALPVFWNLANILAEFLANPGFSAF